MRYMRKTVSGLECPNCKQRIWSRHRHDFRYCFCSYCFIDGGRDYTRWGYGWEDGTATAGIPKSIRINMEDAINELQKQRDRK